MTCVLSGTNRSMRNLFNVLTLAVLLLFSSCIKEEINLLSPELSDFIITPKFLGGAQFILVDPKSKSDGAFIYKVSDTTLVRVDGKMVTIKKSGVYVKGYLERFENDKKYGFSVRCIKN